jgi:outer membrane PBP1 activator LpoA protein
MRIQVGSLPRTLRTMALLAALALATACQAPVRWEDSADKAADAVQAAEQGHHAEAAGKYLELADQYTGAAADHWRILAAQQWLAGRNLDQAARTLESVTGPMDRDDFALWSLLGAQLDLYLGKAEQALQKLEDSPPPTADLAPVFLELKGDSLLKLDRLDQAILAFSEEQTWLDNSADLLASQQRLLEKLKSLQLKGLLPESASPDELVQGWISLARLSARSSADGPAYMVGLRNWRLSFPQHPAASGIVNKLIEQYRGASNYPTQVALLLPLSGREQAFGEAVRDGFLAAYLQSSNKALLPVVRIYDTRKTDAPDSYRSAIADGADMIVGPLLRDDVTNLMGTANGEVPILALNRGNAGGYTPPIFYQFALDPEDEARAAAREAVAQGHFRAIALVPASNWGRRLLDSFTDELTAAGGQLLTSASYDPAEQDYSVPITRALNLDQSKERYRRLSDVLGMYPEFEPRRREDVEFIFVAAQPEQGRLIRPQLKFHYAASVPVYATSAVFQADAMANRDLDGLAFADMPWMLSQAQDNTALRAQVSTALPGFQETQPRLLALGVDAFRLLPWLYNRQEVSGVPGATGLLSVGADGIVQRQLEWARFRSGVPVLLRSGTPDTEDASTLEN